MPYSVPSEAEFNALVARVEALEGSAEMPPGCPVAPPAPTGVAISRSGDRNILTWDVQPSATLGFDIYIQSPIGTPWHYETTDPTLDYPASMPGRYTNWVVARNAAGASGPSLYVILNVD